MRRWHHSLTPIGVDVGGRQIKAVQLWHGSRGWSVAAVTVFPRLAPGPHLEAAEARRLAEVLDRQGFEGNRLVLAVPGHRLLRGNLELPPRSAGAPLGQLARMEMARAHRCDPDSIEMACWELPAASRHQDVSHVMAVACPRTDAEAILGALESAGLEVVSLDVAACALGRACLPLVARGGGIAAVLDLGWDGAHVVLLYQGEVIFERRLAELGLGPVHQAIGQQLALDAEETDYVLATMRLEPGERRQRAGDLPEVRRRLQGYFDSLAGELRSSFSYGSHRYPDQTVRQLAMVGGGANLQGLDLHLARALGVEVQCATPKDLAECSTALLQRCSDPILTLAMGLAQSPER